MTSHNWLMGSSVFYEAYKISPQDGEQKDIGGHQNKGKKVVCSKMTNHYFVHTEKKTALKTSMFYCTNVIKCISQIRTTQGG